jgi:putative restriction endonuclease
MRIKSDFFKGITKEGLIKAMSQIDRGHISKFADSTKFDVLHEDKRYPPKEVVGLALEDLHGREFGPYDFSGGLNTDCFKALTRCGFEVTTKVQFGEIPGIQEGTPFLNYQALNDSGVHRQRIAGIAYLTSTGADSIVVSGGYEDDQDFGDEIIYTGQGGRDDSGKQNADQTLTRGNLALAQSENNNLPVRVIRGSHKGNTYAPDTGYRYDGLYRVDSHWHEIGKSGFKIYRYRLLKITEGMPKQKAVPPKLTTPIGNQNPRRATGTIQRVVRDPKLGKWVKSLHEHKCQVCGMQISTAAGYYAEAAHIKAVGEPHNGPDTIENLLCLCPNHHLMFDKGVFVIGDDFNLIGIQGKIQTHTDHPISNEFIQYHRSVFSDDLLDKKSK